MISGDDIDRAVAKTLLNRLHILPRSKRGIHFGVSIIASDHFFCDSKMMGAGFSRNFEPA